MGCSPSCFEIRSVPPTRTFGWVFFLSLSTCLALACARPARAEGPTVPGVSVVQAPVELDLQPLFDAAESSLPTLAGHWPRWQRRHGVDVRYRAWRGPLWLAVRGDWLQVQAHVRYQLQARRELVGDIGFNVGCGVDEPPRQALVGVLARFDWAPDWSLRPQFRILPTRFLDRCELTVADIDVSPLVGNVFEKQMATVIRDALRGLEPRIKRLRSELERAWTGMQRRQEIMPGMWLHLEPLSLALAPPRGSGSRVQTAVWLSFRAALSADPAPAAQATPLPPFIPYHPASPGLRFNLEIDLDYPGISAALTNSLAGQTANVQGKEARFDGIEFSASGEDLTVVVELGGDLAGRLTITARPGFDAVTQSIRLDAVEFVYDAADPTHWLMASLFYERIRTQIESAANQLLAERTASLRAAMPQALGQVLPAGLVPDLSELNITALSVRARKQGLTLAGSAEGILTLSANTDSAVASP